MREKLNNIIRQDKVKFTEFSLQVYNSTLMVDRSVNLIETKYLPDQIVLIIFI